MEFVPSPRPRANAGKTLDHGRFQPGLGGSSPVRLLNQPGQVVAHQLIDRRAGIEGSLPGPG